jgi:hypothetical protein
MASGSPLANYYASSPLVAEVLDPTKGIFHGPNQSPSDKYLYTLSLISNTGNANGQWMLCDYVLYYPFVDGDSGDVQVMDNTQSLTRYADGEGLQIMAVAVTPTTGGGRLVVTYEDQDGVERTTEEQFCSTSLANISNIVTSQQAVASAPPGPFLKLVSGTTGVRKIVSAQFTVANGGLVSLVLVKPLANIPLYEAANLCEVNFLQTRPFLPKIEEGAFLSFICNAVGSVSGALIVGNATFIWSE